MKDGDDRRLRDGNLMSCRRSGERRKIDPNEIAGLFLDGALEENARFAGGPAKDAETDTETGKMIG